MPVIVACRCGKRFAAKDHLLGQQVACPSCGRALVVAASPTASQGVYVACTCGRAFMAPESMRGKQAQCRGCGRILQVPGTSNDDPLGLGPLGPLEGLPGQVPGPESEIPWDKLKVIGGWGAGLLAIVILITSTLNFIRWIHEQAANEPLVAKAPAVKPKPPPAPAPASSGSSSSRSAKLPPGPRTTESSSAEPNTEVAGNVTDSKSSSAAGIERFPDGVKRWYAQPAEKIKPIPRVKPDDPATTQYSWLTALLPFLGRMELYEQFDFKEPLTKGKNLQPAATVVPEFLNPQDDQHRWKGYPFDGMALTHFVGISGVENARNEVAAKLPRTDPRAGVFGYDEIAGLESIKDGQSHTAMIGGAGALPNPWVFGGGATIRGARDPLFSGTSGLGTKGLPGGGTVVVMADGSVRHVSGSVDPKVFRAMCTINGSESVDLEHASKPYSLDQLKTP